MWCNNCQHGHQPIMRYIKDLDKEVSVCPCCGARLEEKPILTPEQKVQEYAKQMGLDVQIKPKPTQVIGELKETEPVPKQEPITTENVEEKIPEPKQEPELEKKPAPKTRLSKLKKTNGDSVASETV